MKLLNNYWSTSVFVMIFFLLITSSCIQDRFDFDKVSTTNWHPTIATPLANAHIDVYDVFTFTDTSELIVIDPETGLLALRYTDTIRSKKPNDIVPTPDQTISETVILPGGSGSKTVTGTYTFNTSSGVVIDSMHISSGKIKVGISPDNNIDQITVKIPELVKNGQSFDKTAAPSNFDYSVKGYTLDMTNGADNEISYEITVTYSSASSGSRDVTIGIKNWEYSAVFGDFGQQTITAEKDSILLKIFKSAQDEGTIRLFDPKIKLDIFNSFGFVMGIDVAELYSRNTITKVRTDITYDENTPDDCSGSQTKAPFSLPDIKAPNLSEIGQIKETNITIDSCNSSVSDIIKPVPKWVAYDADIVSNPNGSSNNFMTDDSRAKIEALVELPLFGYAYNWTLDDTLDFNFDEENVKEVKKVILRAVIENHYPVNAEMQLYLMDENFNTLDSLIQDSLIQNKEDYVIKSGKVQGTKVVSATTTLLDIPFSQKRVPHLLNAEYLRIKGRAASEKADPENKKVKIFEDYYMDLQLGVKVNGKIKVDT